MIRRRHVLLLPLLLLLWLLLSVYIWVLYISNKADYMYIPIHPHFMPLWSLLILNPNFFITENSPDFETVHCRGVFSLSPKVILYAPSLRSFSWKATFNKRILTVLIEDTIYNQSD